MNGFTSRNIWLDSNNAPVSLFFVARTNRVGIGRECQRKGGSKGAGGSEILRENRSGIQTSELCNYTVGCTIFTGRKGGERACIPSAEISQRAIELGEKPTTPTITR